jgi:ankyrin repeat protein
MISIFLTEQLAKSVHQSKQAILAYYFCENKDHKRNAATAILRGLILQLLRQRRDLFKCILPDFQIREEKLFTSDTALQALWKIFVNMLLRLKQHTIFCILDGLDECEEKSLRTFLRNLNQFFSKVNNPSIGAFKLVAASRDNPQCIRQELSAFARLDLDSEGLQNELSSDIEKYIHFKSRELSDRKCYSEDLRNTVEGVLLNGADGMFLWVSLVCGELEQKLRSETGETLRCLPRGLDAIYGRILLQVEERYRDTVAQVLRWITVAVRPLALRELSAATNTTDEILRDVIKSCRPLLRADGSCVNFLHQSAKDYLLRETPDPDPRVDYFRVSKAEANLELAQACFRYIQSGPYAEGPVKIQELSYCSPADTERLRKFPLMRYATYHWPEHSRCSPASAESVFDLSQPFFQTDSFVRQAWWETYWDATGDIVPKDFTPMHVASFCSLVVLARKLQKDWKRRLGFLNPLHARDSYGKTPLHWAAYNGYKELTRLLLKKGADPEAKDTERAKQTALHFAADNGHEAVVGLLLDFGANVNSQDKNEWTALHSAAQSGHEAVARLLLEKAADLDAREGDGRTALHFAAECGHEAIARLLIEGGADLEAEDSTGGVALHEAAANGDKAIVQLLLDKGADIEARTMDGESALCFAAEYGCETIVRLLLEKGANPNYEADHGKAVILLAAANGQQAVVRLLLERDDVDPNYYGEIALLSAAKNGHESVVRLLLDRDIFQGSKDWLAIAQIYNAVKAGQESLVQLLLENDSVDSNQKDSSGRTLLSWAASTNCSAVVKLLLERGRADPESKDRLGCTPLWHAVNHNRESVVRLLLEAGADPESKDVYGSSPLSLTKNQFRDGLAPILKQYARTRRRAC